MERQSSLLGLTETHEELRKVLDRLDSLNAGIVRFKVEDLSEHEANGWLRSERRRLEKLVGMLGDVNA